MGKLSRWVLLLMGLALIMGLKALAGRSLPDASALLVTALASGCAAGAVVGGAIARYTPARALRIRWRELAARGALIGAAASMASLWWCPRTAGPEALLFAAAFGAIAAVAATALFQPVLNDAEHEFARALDDLRRGDRKGARAALRSYLKCADQDPLRAARIPAAERFLAGETDTLVVATELEASSAPAGRGTELAAAEPPVGRGTELESLPAEAPPVVTDQPGQRYDEGQVARPR